jgi:hypothetical protein
MTVTTIRPAGSVAATHQAAKAPTPFSAATS